jgi:hypothetical protein
MGKLVGKKVPRHPTVRDERAAEVAKSYEV